MGSYLVMKVVADADCEFKVNVNALLCWVVSYLVLDNDITLRKMSHYFW